MKCSHSLRGRPWGLTRLKWWMESWQPSLHWNEKRCVGQSQVSDNDLQHVRETAFHKPRTTLHLVSVPSKELYAKTPGTHFPENPIFLSSSSDADTEQETAGNKGDVEGQKNSSPDQSFSCTRRAMQTSNKRLLDTRGT